LKKGLLSALKPILQGAKIDELIPSISGYKDRCLDLKNKEKNEIRERFKLYAERLKLNEKNSNCYLASFAQQLK